MTSIPLSAKPVENRYVRPLNILRDLPRVADLIEQCFATSMDSEGRAYVRQMRRASKDSSFMRWASNRIESTSLPLSGFVWEQDGQIIGNTSLILFRHQGRRIYLLANVATHPEHRRKGIARALTEHAVHRAHQRGANEIWLHARADNPAAVQMYLHLGFTERARRTTWRARKETGSSPVNQPPEPARVVISKRHPRFWPQQRAWLESLHPEGLAWYRSLNWKHLKPGLWTWLYRLMVDLDLRQWAVEKNRQLQGTLSWIPSIRGAPLWLACDREADPDSITTLLRKASRELGYRPNLKLEHPAGLQAEALEEAGFEELRTLIWMCLENAT